MTPTQGMPGTGQKGQLGIDNIQETAMNIIYNVASIVTMPVEIFLRPQYGTRYFSAPIFFLSAMMLIVMSAFFGIMSGIGQMVPFVQVRGPVGIFGLGSFTRLFFLASAIHGYRTWKRMIHPETEQLSTYEGPALSFFKLLPKGDGFWFVRLVYEPVMLFAAAILLGSMQIIQSPLALYFQFAALWLAMKEYISWYRTWEYVRILLDMANMGPIIAKIISNSATDDELARVHLASLPKNMPPEMRRATIAHIARAFSAPVPEEEEKPVARRNPEAGVALLKVIFLLALIAGFLYLTMGGGIGQHRVVRRVMPRAAAKGLAVRPNGVSAQVPGSATAPGIDGGAPSESTATPPPPPEFLKLAGHWQGHSLIAKRGTCEMKLEIRATPDNQFAGYSTLTCAPIWQFDTKTKTAQEILKEITRVQSPTSAILLGPVEGDSIRFKAGKIIDAAADGCRMSSVTVTPFGTGEIATVWEDSPCQGGQMVMKRVN